MKFLPFNTTKTFFLYEKVRFKVLGLFMLMNQELYVIVSENQFNNLNTVKPLLTTTLRSDQTPYNDQTTCPRFTLL